MIVTENSSSGYGQVVLQKDHADLAFQLAEAFGNASFEGLEPRDLMPFLVLNHDRGWDQIDECIGRNPRTGLPFSLVQTPLDQLLLTGPRSVEFNAAFHPYCGLLACMHVWGLFNGRYGLSDKIVVDMLQGEAKAKADAMLKGLQRRQAELEAEMAQDPLYKDYAAPSKLMQNYKLLQLFDTLSLYFNENAGRDGEASSFLNVPQTADRDASVEISPLGQRCYRLSPFPFNSPLVSVTQKVYEIPVLELDEVDYVQVFAESASTIETITLVA